MDAKTAESLGEFLQKITKQVIDGTADWIEYENTAVTALRNAGNSGTQLRSQTNALIKETTKLAHAYGTTFDNLVKIQQKFGEITQSTSAVSSTTLRDFTALSKLFGDSAPFEWAEAMQKFGMSASTSNSWLGRASIEAKALGLHAGKFAQEMTAAAKLQNSINFRNGVQGLEKMTGLAMRLGTSVESLSKHINIDNGAFSNIEKSIEASASLQRLGGSFGAAFSNPLEVMAEGMFDAEAGMERLANSLKGKGTFNRATGQVDMGWYDKASIGAAAQALGMSPDEARNIANKQVQNTAIEQDLKAKNSQFANFSQEDIAAIQNLAQFNAETGNFEISYSENGETKTANINSLTPEQLGKIKGLSEEEKNVDRNVANIAGQVKIIADAMTGKAKDTTTTRESINGAKEALKGTRADMTTSLGLDQVVTETKNTIQSVPTWREVLSKIWPFEKGGIVNDGYTVGDILKPTTQGFDDGGFVNGSGSNWGDKHIIRANPGEMILNKSQQAQLYNMASGNYSMTGISKGAYGINSSQISEGIVNGLNKTRNFTVGDGLRKGRQARKLFTSTVLDWNYAPTRMVSNKNYANRVARMQLRKLDKKFNLPILSKVANKVEKYSTNLDKGRTFIGSKVKGVGRGVKGIGSKGLKLVGKSRLGRKGIGSVVGMFQLAQQTKIYDKLGNAVDKFSNATNSFKQGTKSFTTKVKSTKIGTRNLTSTSNNLQFGSYDSTDRILKSNKPSTKKIPPKGKGKLGKLGKLGKIGGKLGKVGNILNAVTTVASVGSMISSSNQEIKNIESNSELSTFEKKALKKQAENDRNEATGEAIGAVAGMAISKAVGAIPVVGTALSVGLSATGLDSVIGAKIGGFIGKNWNKGKEFLFGKDAEISEEDQAQLDYEESKFGKVDIEDPQLMEKAAMATVAMHDLLISIWNKMNGKEFNGEEKSKGLFGNIASGIGTLAKGAVGVASTLLTGPVGMIGSLIGKKKDKKGKDSKEVSEDDPIVKIQETVNKINTNLEAFLGNVEETSKEGEDEETKSDKSSIKGALLGSVVGGLLLGPMGIGLGGIAGRFIKSKVDSEKVNPKPLGEDSVEVKDTESTEDTTSTPTSDTTTIKLEISGTLKLDGGTAQKELDMAKLLDSPFVQQKLIDIIYQGLEKRGGMGRMDKNSQRNVLQGSTVNMSR